jgi:hypothetical protein
MISGGYMFKKVGRRPDWLGAANVDDIYSLSGCISSNFTDYINYWKHNGYWLFDAPVTMAEICAENHLDLADTTLFYYEVFCEEFDTNSRRWSAFEPELSFPTHVFPTHVFPTHVFPTHVFPTHVEQPGVVRLEGYDVVTFSANSSPECSPLSCNGLAAEIATNRHCLFETLEQAKRALEAGAFDHSEPGPFRIFAVHTRDT